MRNRYRAVLLSAACAAAWAGSARAAGPEQFLSGNDFAIAIDAIPNFYLDNTGTGGTASMYPGGEPPAGAVDGSTASKYLNFGRRGSGFIVVQGASTVQSFQISTANDAVERDPASYVLLGTNNPVVSTDRGNGLGGETWTLIQQGSLALPDTRTTAGPVVNVVNSTSYSAYKMYFPTVKNAAPANSMQLSEVQFFDQPNGAGNPFFNPVSDIRAIDNPQSDSSHNTTEAAKFCLDQNPNTKYLNLMNGSSGNDTHHGAGLAVTPARGPSIVTSFQITTANDASTRDPNGYVIYGTNDPISGSNVDDGDGNGGENWVQIATGSLTLPDTRLTAGAVIPISNSTVYNSYKIVFTGTKGSSNCQIADIAFTGTLTGQTEWLTNASGNWFIGGNWYGPTPNGIDETARFLTKSTSPHTVFTDSPVTLGTLRIENSSTYLLTGAGNITMQVSSGAASINVSGASHKINLPLTIASDTNIAVAGGATLTIGNPTTVNVGKTLNTTGSVIFQAPLIINTGASLAVKGGQPTLSGAPSLEADATVDVKNNSLLIDYRGHSSPASVIKDQLIGGYAGGAWDGSGINTSSATSSVGLGWTDDAASQSILVKYAYYGDANLDSVVDTIDFNVLAANFGDAGKGWSQADSNYDGVVDTIDFNLLAANFGKQLAPPSTLGGLVPEPASVGILALAGMAGACSRRCPKMFLESGPVEV